MLDMGCVPVGLATTKNWKIINPGDLPLVVYTKSNHEHITIEPDRFHLPPKQSLFIDLTIKPTEEKSYLDKSTSISLIVRGGQTYNLPIRAEAQIPDVVLTEDEYNMGDVIVGARHKETVKV